LSESSTTWINQSSPGLSFVGHRIFPNLIRACAKNRRRSLGKLSLRHRQWRAGWLTDEQWEACLTSPTGYHHYFAGADRVNRGGNWNKEASNARCANRNNNDPGNRNNNLGFRLLITGERAEAGAITVARADPLHRPGALAVEAKFPARRGGCGNEARRKASAESASCSLRCQGPAWQRIRRFALGLVVKGRVAEDEREF
jgi:hypothetical protein